MKKIITLITFLLTVASFGQVGFQQNVIVDLSYGVLGPTTVASADINNDGLADLAAGSANRLVWYNNINGDYETAITVSNEGNGVNQVYIEDMDGDGAKDIVFTTLYNNEIAWCKNLDGLGNFGLRQLIASDLGYSSRLQLTDMDGDGDMDILYYGMDALKWKNNDGAGTFTNSVAYNGDYAESYHAVDLDADGDKDIILDIGNNLRCYRNNGSTGYSLIETIDSFALINPVMSIDFDNDNDMDIVCVFSNGNDKHIRWYANTDGMGTFGNAQTLVTGLPYNIEGEVQPAYRMVIPTDIDNDGLIDFVVGTESINRVAWYKNLGALSFGPEQIITNEIVNPKGVTVADIDNDGDKDVISSSLDDHKIAWYQNTNGLGTFGSQLLITRGAIHVTKADAGDIDGDGDVDIVSSSRAEKKIAWYKNTDGLGAFTEDQIIVNIGFNNPQNVQLADIDGDGDLDILASSFTDNNSVVTSKVIWFKNTNAAFTLQTPIVDNTSAVSAVYNDDIDNDGDVDIIVLAQINFNSTEASYYKNNGDGTFGPKQVVPNTPIKHNPGVLEDMDNDGDKDLLMSFKGIEVSWFENVNGDFITKHIVFTGTPTLLVNAGDVNGDDLKDVLFNNDGQNKMGYFLNMGDGTYGPEVIVSTTVDNSFYNYSHDFDGDGDQDIISASNTGFKLAWYQNDGLGVFGPAIEVPGESSVVNNILFKDIDADGTEDMLITSLHQSKIVWYKNLGAYDNKIRGIVRLDANANGCDAADTTVPQVMVTTQNGTNTFSTFTQPNGEFEFSADVSQYTTTITSPLVNFEANPLSYTSIFTETGTIETANFCLAASQPVTDLEISMYALNEPQPGFTATYRVIVRNNGTIPLNGGFSLTYNNAKINYLAASVAPTSNTGNVINFDFTDLIPFQAITVDITFSVNLIPVVTLGDNLAFTAVLNTVAEDITPSNNQIEINETIIGSYDPNDITVLEGESIIPEQADDYLHYIIRFQNTGSAPAQRVRIYNELDSKLDWSTMQIETYSHSNRVEIINGNEVNFIFDAIYLPHSGDNEPASHGYIAYKIKPKNNVVIGDVFHNSAEIYFDFNPAIITNTVATTIVEPVESVTVGVANGDAVITADNGTLQLTAVVLPATANQNVVWSIISGSEYATIDSSGLVTAISNGTVTIQAVSAENGTILDTIDVIITGQSTPVTSISVEVADNGSPAITTNNGTLQLAAVVLPATANQNVVWSIISGGEYATIDINGVVTAISNGTVTIQAVSAENGTIAGTIEIVITGQTLGLNDIRQEKFIIYPNPAESIITITSTLDIKEIVIYNALAQEAVRAKSHTIDISVLTTGTYYIDVRFSDGTSAIKKLIRK